MPRVQNSKSGSESDDPEFKPIGVRAPKVPEVTMEAVTDVPVKSAPLSTAQREWYRRAAALVDEELVREIVVEMTDIPSPTGEEAELADYLANRGRSHGLDASVQPLDKLSANALVRRPGDGDGGFYQ